MHMSNSSSALSDGATIEQVESWLRQGEDLRAKLEQEEADLTRRLGAVRAALANLPRPGSTSPFKAAAIVKNGSTPQVVTVGELKEMSIPELIKMLAADLPEGISAGGLVRMVRDLRPQAK